MRKQFRLSCLEVNQRHTKFNVFDPHGANCGTLTLLTKEVKDFLRFDWNAEIDWNGLGIKWQDITEGKEVA